LTKCEPEPTAASPQRDRPVAHLALRRRSNGRKPWGGWDPPAKWRGGLCVGSSVSDSPVFVRHLGEVAGHTL